MDADLAQLLGKGLKAIAENDRKLANKYFSTFANLIKIREKGDVQTLDMKNKNPQA